ncbi:MAG: CvpA family protein [Planctomycetota bacterium]
MVSILQDPPAAAAPGSNFLQLLEQLGWVDRTALGVLATFFVIGLFKGLIWQVSRIAILAAAYVVAGHFGAGLGAFLARTPAVGGSTPVEGAAVDTPETTLYLAYVLLFLAVLVVLSLAAILVKKLANKAGLGFFDRLGGGVLGVATGAAVVLFGLFVVNMFFRGSQLSMAAESSHSLRLSRQAVAWLGPKVPDPLRGVLALAPLRAKTGPDAERTPGETTNGAAQHVEPGRVPGSSPAPSQTTAPDQPGPTDGTRPPSSPPASPGARGGGKKNSG